MLKKLNYLFILIAVMFNFSCLSFQPSEPIAYLDLEVDQTVTIYTNNRINKFVVNNMEYSPNEKDSTIASLKLEINNNSNTVIEKSVTNKIELLVVNDSLDYQLVPATRRSSYTDDSDDLFDQTYVEQGTNLSDTYYFIHNKNYTSVALMYNRFNMVALIEPDDELYSIIDEVFIEKSNIEKLMQKVPYSEYSDVKNFMTENSINLNALNINNLNILSVALLTNNRDVVIGSIKDGINIHSPYSISYNTVHPIHSAVIMQDRELIDLLLASGASFYGFDKMIDDIPVFCVRNDKIESLKMLVEEYGVDVSDLEIPMSWSGPITALKFCESKGRTDMLAYLKSIQ